MTNYPTKLQEAVLPLPETVNQTELNLRGLYIVQGLDATLAEQLVQSSRQTHIAAYSNDANKRFNNTEAVTRWQNKGRLALPLVKLAGNGALLLAGFGWMGPQTPGEDGPSIPGAETTFAIRIYDMAVGQGNALPYTKAILAANDTLYGNQGVWLEAWSDNKAALRTYEKAGFTKVAEIPGLRHGEEVPRIYMTLGEL